VSTGSTPPATTPAESADASSRFDVAIIGGALSGAATAILLLRKDPGLRVVVIEKSTAFSRRVGEATVEVSGYFLGRVLGLTQHLNEAHLVKQGMRFWFANAQTSSIPDCSEFGGLFLSRLPAYQVDRAVLDEEILRRARAAGATVLRPASVASVTLNSGAEQIITVRQAGETRELRCRWVVDASGVGALLSRQNGWWRPNEEHPTTAVWARWTGVKDWDGLELADKYPDWARACHGIRGTATNHLTGDGWWAWCIPLKGGDVSIGVVFDQRLVQWPDAGSLGERLKAFLSQHPVGRELLENATPIEGDVHWRKNLAYYSTTFAGDGFTLVGDAAGFIDPLYSPGMDWISYTASTTAELIAAQRSGESVAALAEDHNRRLAQSYRHWFVALYKDKYSYLGEYDLMRLAFLLDLGLYYFGVVSQPFKLGAMAFKTPMFSNRLSTPFYHFIRFYNRRLARIAQHRRETSRNGRANFRRRFMFGGYTFAPGSAKHIIKALLAWGVLEMTEGWKTWFRRVPVGARPAMHPEAPYAQVYQAVK
jgi:flavin-dependent dehydrogenase